MALGAAIASNCVPCIEYHVPEARKAGLKEAQIRQNRVHIVAIEDTPEAPGGALSLDNPARDVDAAETRQTALVRAPVH